MKISRTYLGIISLLSFGPILLLVFKSFTPDISDDNSWDFVLTNMVPELLLNTGALAFLVAVFTSFLGVTLASLTVFTNLPFKKVFDYLFILPITFPLYVLAFIYVGMFEYSSGLMTFFRESIGLNLNAWLDIKSVWAVALIFSLGLYPYVYLLSKNAFINTGERMVQASRALGHNPRETFLNVILRYSLPWVLTGTGLALMETLADFGGVSVFNYNTFTTAIYTAWSGLFSLSSAARLSCFLLVMALLLYLLEARMSARARHVSLGTTRSHHLLREFGPLGKALVFLFALAVVSLSLIVPLTQLCFWFFEALSFEWSSVYWSLLKNTFSLGITAAFFTAFVSLGMVLARRMDSSPLPQFLCSLSLLGYALPGNLVAVAVFLYFQQFKPHIPSALSFLVAPLVLLILGYLIRYISVSFRAQSNALKALNPNFDKVAKTLGANQAQIFKDITFPLISPAFVGSLVLIFIEVIKEMPMTLMLRPYGMNTLAVRIYELTSEGEWQRASVAAVFIVVCGMLGTLLIGRMDHKNH